MNVQKCGQGVNSRFDVISGSHVYRAEIKNYVDTIVANDGQLDSGLKCMCTILSLKIGVLGRAGFLLKVDGHPPLNDFCLPYIVATPKI